MEDSFNTITSNIGEGYYTEKRSKFLAFAHHVETVDEAMDIVKEYRKKYYDARHCCFAYVIGPDGDVFRSNDDGEPSSTAGKPILGQIRSHNLTDILIVVVRYYGGVNLGTSGLIVAYRTAAADAISHSQTVVQIVEEQVKYDFTYPMMNAVMRLTKEMPVRIVNQHFDIECSITLAIRKSLVPQLQHRLDEITINYK